MDDRKTMSALARAARRSVRRGSEGAEQRDLERDLIQVGEEIARRSAAAFRRALAGA